MLLNAPSGNLDLFFSGVGQDGEAAPISCKERKGSTLL